jgi:hypothetical protein
VRNPHLARLVQEFADYVLLARTFRQPTVAELEQPGGVRRQFCVVAMPSVAHRRRLLYDLTARLVDDTDLPVDLVVVSNWARTGWNVVRPNLLIDATATRSVIAWQQLRGRALRAPRSWMSDCYRLVASLIGEESLVDAEPDGARLALPLTLDESLLYLLQEIAPDDLRPRLEHAGLAGFSPAERRRLAVALLLARNKATHVYELLKGFGAGSQVRYDRKRKVWCRRESVARKHLRMVAVDPWTGRKTRGEAGAPLLYARDPRTDLPEALQAQLTDALSGRDTVIVDGWLDRESLPDQRAGS